MSRFAAQFLDLVLADFPADLLPPGGAKALRAIAGALAPWRMTYLECRLAGAGRQVDIAQHFHAADDGRQALGELAESQLRQTGSEAWRRIAAIAGAWSVDGPLADAAEMGLEYDCGPGGWSPAPAMFAGFRSPLLDNREAASAFAAMASQGGAEAWRHMLETLDVAAECGLSDGGMIGAMLSRDAELRCMLGHPHPDRLARFFDRLGRSDEAAPALDLLSDPIFPHDRCWLVLGFRPRLVAGCGIEVIHGRAADAAAAREAFVDWLLDRGLAAPSLAATLDAWRGAITPLSARSDWPDALVARALSDQPNALPYLRKFVNHFKLNISGGKIAAAKAYLAVAPADGRG